MSKKPDRSGHATQTPARRRILISVNSSWNIPNFRRGLIERLQGAGYDIIVAAPRDEHSPAITALGCTYIDLPMKVRSRSPLADLAVVRRFVQIMRAERPDVFIGFTAKPNIYGAIAAGFLKIPVINNISGLGSVFNETGLTNRVMKLLYRIALRRSRCVFFQNESDEAIFLKEGLVRPGQTALLPGSGVDLEAFRPCTPADPGGPVVFLLIARLLREKGIAELVAAADIARAHGCSIDVRVVGFLNDGNPDFVQSGEFAAWQAAGKATYLGPSDDVRPQIAAADCLVLPTYYPEGTPRTLLEAAAMGKPIITTDMPGCRTVVNDGRNGFLVAPRDAQSLAQGMIAFAALSPQARETMGRESRAHAEQTFDQAIVADRYLCALAKIEQPGR